MVSAADFTQVCNATITSTRECTPETCCLAQGQLQYLPSFAGNITFVVLFGLCMFPNTFFGIRYRTWTFFAWVTLGLLGEIAGYIGRIMLHDNIFNFDAFLTYLISLTIAPAFITASIYLCLARIIYIVDPRLTSTRLKPTTYTKIFVTFDIIALILQGAGGGIAATADTKEMVDLGVHVMIAGLAFQVFSLVVFSGLCADFAWRLRRTNRRSPVSRVDVDTPYDSDLTIGKSAADYSDISTSVMFKAMIGAMAVAVLLILVRSVYRLIELQGGFDGALANNETLFTVFEGPFIFLACAVLVICHPGIALKGIWSMKDLQRSNTGTEDVMLTSAAA
ncbi:RTA1 like protein-domain-containing protein [Nemania serpens]|nr:RTA1 like protein-domain-containing protein [Nemania serpens]